MWSPIIFIINPYNDHTDITLFDEQSSNVVTEQVRTSSVPSDMVIFLFQSKLVLSERKRKENMILFWWRLTVPKNDDGWTFYLKIERTFTLIVYFSSFLHFISIVFFFALIYIHVHDTPIHSFMFAYVTLINSIFFVLFVLRFLVFRWHLCN